MQPSNELIKPVVSNLALSNEDLYSPRVEAFIEEQSVIARATPEAPPRAWYAKVLYSSCFYLSFAGMLGGDRRDAHAECCAGRRAAGELLFCRRPGWSYYSSDRRGGLACVAC